MDSEWEEEEEESESDPSEKYPNKSMNSYDPKKDRILAISSDETDLLDKSLRNWNPDEKPVGNIDRDKLKDYGLA